MSTKFTDEEFLEAASLSKTWVEVARRLRVSERFVYMERGRIEQNIGTPLKLGVVEERQVLPPPPLVPDEPLEARERRRYQDKIKSLSDELKRAHQQLNGDDDLRSAVFNLASRPVKPPAWTLKPLPTKASPGTPILLASDFQWGEVINAKELDGLNEFNREVASRRYKRLIQTTIDLCFNHTVNPKYNGIYYLRGGDMVSGEIHEELARTNDLHSVEAVHDLVEHEAAGIQALAANFGRVEVISVPGNHGRTTMKPHSKRYVATNYDTLIAWMLEREFRGDKRVSFQTPMSGDALFTVHGHRCLLTHGDRIGSRGGQGFIGPAATIARGMKKLTDYYAARGIGIDTIFIGHFHTALELELGFCNGSLPGYSEYARDFRMHPQPPSQWLFHVHPAWGITTRWKVYLEQPVRTMAVQQSGAA